MKLYHQAGFRWQWNLASFSEDDTGSGLIFSPVNIAPDKLEKISSETKEVSFLDPQIYLPKEIKGSLKDYSYFPTALMKSFQTGDFDAVKDQIAEYCINLQIENSFRYIVIPTRYSETPTDYYEQNMEYFIDPFLEYCSAIETSKDILLTLIVNEAQLRNDEYRNELLNLVTGIQEVSGVYLIFQNNSPTKQIKDAEYLFYALVFINALKLNDLEVHIGYNNTEGLLYWIAGPDSISMGAYENLRRFSPKRFIEATKSKQKGPNPRLYSRRLLQWIEHGYIGPIKFLYEDWNLIFEDSKYKPTIFEPNYNWHFTKPELYKHFFIVFSSQVSELPVTDLNGRMRFLKQSIQTALTTYKELDQAGIPLSLDDNSNGTHLNFWLASMNMFQKHLEDSRP